jgi:hypothetical protein
MTGSFCQARTRSSSDTLYAAREIDILVVGYSGLDHEILRFIKGSDPKIRYMTIVSSTLAEAEEVGERFRGSGLESVWYEPVSGNFASWSNSGGPNRLIEEYGGPYSRAR